MDKFIRNLKRAIKEQEQKEIDTINAAYMRFNVNTMELPDKSNTSPHLRTWEYVNRENDRNIFWTCTLHHLYSN